MALNHKRVNTIKASYWQVFRLIFVIFSLYLLGDAFYRWDGFSYYATFAEFLPGVALITVLWSIVAVIVALIIWLLGGVLKWFCQIMKWKFRLEHLLMLIVGIILLGTAVWGIKLLKFPQLHTTFQFKLKLFLSVALITVFVTWLFRNKGEQLISFIQERITPLVWLFSLWLIISIPLVIYHTWGKQSDNVEWRPPPNSSVADKNRPNIILVVFDALTARDMSAYGYQRPTTPFISEWSKEATLFARVQSESNMTTPATTSLMTSKRLWTHQVYYQVRGASQKVKSNNENMALLLKDNGYYTMAFVANPYASVKALGITDSFYIAPLTTDFKIPVSLLGIIDKSLYRFFASKIRLYDWIIKQDFILNKILKTASRNFIETEVPPEKAFNVFLDVIDGGVPEPYFAWIHLLPPHDPYLPPEPYIGTFDSSPELRSFKSQEELVRSVSKNIYKFNDFPLHVKPMVKTLRSRYDEFISYCDEQFENFMEQLSTRNALENTVVMLTSDHGESFEHNYLKHGYNRLYEQVTHIPLIIKEPEQTEGRVVNDLSEQIDIAPTILELANISIPSWMEGRSLLPLIRGETLPGKLIYSMALESSPSRGQEIRNGAIAVWEGKYKLIHNLQDRRSQLFNLSEDPDETINLFEEESEVGQNLLKKIQDGLESANERIVRGD